MDARHLLANIVNEGLTLDLQTSCSTDEQVSFKKTGSECYNRNTY